MAWSTMGGGEPGLGGELWLEGAESGWANWGVGGLNWGLGVRTGAGGGGEAGLQGMNWAGGGGPGLGAGPGLGDRAWGGQTGALGGGG